MFEACYHCSLVNKYPPCYIVTNPVNKRTDFCSAEICNGKMYGTKLYNFTRLDLYVTHVAHLRVTFVAKIVQCSTIMLDLLDSTIEACICN